MSVAELHVAEEDAAAFRAAGAPDPEVVIVAGSGLRGLGEIVEEPVSVEFTALPAFPHTKSGVLGHDGRIVAGRVEGVTVAVFLGRLHLYQGVSALDAAYPARFAATLGADTLIVTNAAGGISPDLAAGEVVALRDHINLTGANPLVGWSGPEGGTPFVSMREAYDHGLRAIARRVADEQGFPLRECVYAGLLGPTYETPAEVEYLRAVGADIVGMSTVPEVIAARALGLRVLGLSLVTNIAGASGLSHADVLEAGKHAEESLLALVAGILRRL